MKTVLLLISALGMLNLSFCQKKTSLDDISICDWYGGKSAALSVTFDDNCEGQFTYALPIMDKRQIKSTFYVNTGEFGGCNALNWEHVHLALKTGHEIGSHTVNHLDLSKIEADKIEYQLKACKDTIDKHIGVGKCQTLAYPYGAGGTNTEKDESIRVIAAKYYIGARGAGSDQTGFITYAAATSPYYTNFDYQIGSFAISPSVTLEAFKTVVDGAIAHSGWFIPQYHGIETGGFANIPAQSFEEQMNYVKGKETQLWVAPFVDVFKYQKEKRNATLFAEKTKNGLEITLSDKLSDKIFNQALTLKIPKYYKVTTALQGDKKIQLTENNEFIYISIIPNQGKVILK